MMFPQFHPADSSQWKSLRIIHFIVWDFERVILDGIGGHWKILIEGDVKIDGGAPRLERSIEEQSLRYHEDEQLSLEEWQKEKAMAKKKGCLIVCLLEVCSFMYDKNDWQNDKLSEGWCWSFVTNFKSCSPLRMMRLTLRGKLNS